MMNSRLLFAAAAALSLGCYQSTPEDQACRALSGCFDTGPLVCLHEIAAGNTDTTHCRIIEVTATSDSCADSTARVNVVVNTEGANSVWMDASVLEVPPGAPIAGYHHPGASCDPCGAGLENNSPTAGRVYTSDDGLGTASRSELDYVFVGRNVRYSVKFCALAGSAP